MTQPDYSSTFFGGLSKQVHPLRKKRWYYPNNFKGQWMWQPRYNGNKLIIRMRFNRKFQKMLDSVED